MKSISVKKVFVVLFSVVAIFALFAISAYAENYGSFSYSYVEPEDGDNFETHNEIIGYSEDDTSTMTVVEIPAEIEGVPVTKISATAFNRKESLTEVIIPDTVTVIENGAFFGCKSLKVVIIPDSVTFIGDSAFQNCESLEYVVIGSGVTEIGDIAFKGCTSLKILSVGDSVKKIGNGAFFDCPALSGVRIPASVDQIGSLAFGYVQDEDIEALTEGFKFYCDAPVGAVTEYAAESAITVVETAKCGDSESAHSLEWALARPAKETYDGLEIACCAECKAVLTKVNTDIVSEENKDSALITLIIVVVIIAAVAVWILLYIKKSKKRRAKAIEDYKAGRPFDTDAERIAQTEKLNAQEAKKRAKQEEKLKKEQEIQS